MFITTKHGKQMPCDAESIAILPSDVAHDGSSRDIVSGITAGGQMLRGRRATREEIEANPDLDRVHVSHFATCPHAASFRKPRGGA